MISMTRTSAALRRALALLLILFAILVSRTASAISPVPSAVRHGYEYYQIGDLHKTRPGSIEPGLLLMGGGKWAPGAFAWFAAKGGHGHFVILRASGDDGLQKEFYTDMGGVASVQTLVFHSRDAASDPEVLRMVRQADGIFIAGGDQSNYVRFWKGTPLNTLLNAHVAQGKPIGGTSAGLAILGAYAYGAMDGGSITSAEALRDPLGSAVTLVDDFMRLPNMQHVITDTHFRVRQRQGRLIAFLANLQHAGHREMVGLGVDQDSALCVDGAGIGRLHTLDNGFAWLVRPGSVSVVQKNEPLDETGVRISGIGTRSSIDLRTLQVTRPAFELIADVHHGRLTLHGKAPPQQVQ